MADVGNLHRYLSARNTPHALIGAVALGLHGFSRATVDIDFLTTSRDILADRYWDALRAVDWQIEVRRGDESDPLAGVVRMRAPASERELDVIVGKRIWQTAVIERCEPAVVDGEKLPVVRAADLILLKLDAGGPQDLNDILALVGVSRDGEALRAEVDAAVEAIGDEGRAAWTRLFSR